MLVKPRAGVRTSVPWSQDGGEIRVTNSALASVPSLQAVNIDSEPTEF